MAPVCKNGKQYVTSESMKISMEKIEVLVKKIFSKEIWEFKEFKWFLPQPSLLSLFRDCHFHNILRVLGKSVIKNNSGRGNLC